MKKPITLLFTLGILLGLPSAWGQCSELFISEYLEGSSNNKALELYNPTAASINLTDYKMYRFNNGAVTPNDSLFPQGSIDAYGTFTIVNPSGDPAILSVADTTHTMTFYNGDDAILLIKIATGDTLDAIGIVGIDPGSAWPVGATGETRENTLVRKAGVGGGTTDWTASSASEWDVYPADSFGFLGSHGSVCDPNYTVVYPIGLVTDDADGDGAGDSVGVACELRGVVHGIDMNGGGSVSFTIIDGTGGIGIFSSNSFGYTVTEGDSVHIPGTIGQFNGLTQISPDTIIVASTGNALKTPATITSLDETTESELIRFESAYLVDPADWPTATGSVNVDITNGTDTILMRIDSDTDIDGTVGPPADTFNVVGLGGQFDSSSPYNDGYQLLPRYYMDLEADTAVGPPVFNLPIYAIGLVTDDADGDGAGDSVGVACELRGVVYGVDMNGGGSVSFTFIDGTGGIGLFSSNSYGYTVLEGDSVHIPGTISQFNGLTQINPDTIVLVSSGNALVDPAVITSLDETTESELIRFNDAYLVDPAQWPSGGGSANVDVTNGPDTILVRIDSDTDLSGTPAPIDTFDIVGLGGQFDGSAPYNDGYQLLPRYQPDVIQDTSGFNGLPVYPIGLITADADGDGAGDSVGVACEVRGVVYGVDMNGGGSVSFTVIDNSGGIGVFSGNAYGYTVLEGDSVRIPGTVGQFNGLTQMSPDTIILVSGGNALVSPLVITSMDETTESELIRFNNAYLVDPSQWPTSTGSANVDITNGVDTLLMRIDSDTDLDGTPAPTGLFDVIGLGGQFDNSSPYNDGYQLLPRYQPDVIQVAAPGFSFVPAAAIVGEDAGIVSLNVGLSNAFPDTTTVQVVLGTGGSATDGVDFLTWMDTTLTFPAGSVGPIALSVEIVDDADVEADETVVLNLFNPTGGAALGDSVFTLTIEDNDYPIYPIGLITADADNNGVGDSLDVSCELQGLIYGVDMQGSANIQFTLIDSTDGINIFSTNDFGLTLVEGDEVIVRGTIEAFNGLTEIFPDTIILLSSGNATIDPLVVTTLDETTESELIQINCLALLDTAAWPASGSSFNLQATNGVDTFTVRIDSDTDIDGTPVPMGKWLNISGLGGQFDGSTPPLGGYQLLPRYLSDITERPDPTVSFIASAASINEGDTTLEIMIIQSDGNPDTTNVTVGINATGTTATNGDDFLFSPTTVQLSGCGADTTIISVQIVGDMLTEGDEDIVFQISEVSNNGMIDTLEYTLTIVDQIIDGIQSLSANAIQMYPNPTSNQVRLQSDLRMEQLTVRNLLGQTVQQARPQSFDTRLNLSQLPQGVYLISVETPEGIWQQKLIKE